MDLTIRSFNFCVGSLGSIRVLDLVNSGSSVGKTAAASILETSVGSSGEVNSPFSIKPIKGSTVEELKEIMENFDLVESLGYSNRSSAKPRQVIRLFRRRFHGLLWQYLQQL
jgi:hypothetical protein